MDNRDSVIEEQKPFIRVVQDGFVKAVGQSVTYTMTEANKIVKAGKSTRSLDQQIEMLHNTQQNYILMILIQLFISLTAIGIYKIIEMVHLFELVAEIIMISSLALYVLCMAVVQFGGDFARSNPQNIFIFTFCVILRVLWISYMVVINQLEFLKLELIELIRFLDVLTIFIFFQFDKKTTPSCFLITSQYYRLPIILIIQFTLIYFAIEFTHWSIAILWITIIIFSYLYCLLEFQLIEQRSYLMKTGNAWYLSLALFDGDLVFPCEMIQYIIDL